MHGMTISRAAVAAGVGVETIRFYERRGLIEQPPRPRDGGYRVYPAGTVRRVRFIRQAQELGFSLREAAELLSLRSDETAQAVDVRGRVRAKLTDVDAKLRRLQEIRRGLEGLLAACPGRGPVDGCSIIEAIERAERRAANAEGRAP